jgi:hypothetical protein
MLWFVPFISWFSSARRKRTIIESVGVKQPEWMRSARMAREDFGQRAA